MNTTAPNIHHGIFEQNTEMGAISFSGIFNPGLGSLHVAQAATPLEPPEDLARCLTILSLNDLVLAT